MRVKKPTSKRMTTRLREGIKKKASAQRRKDKKAAKKDVTWKSRHPKDLGIPSSFPYKDKIIAEIETRKKEKEEEQRRMKEQKRAAQIAGHENIDNDDAEMVIDEEVEKDLGNDMAALIQSAEAAAKEFNGDDDNGVLGDDMVDDDFEIVEKEIDIDGDDNETNNIEIEKSRKQFDKVFKAVVDAADVVLYVLDARDPESTRSKKIEESILQHQGKRLIFLLNKIDLVPDEVVKQWVNFLGSSFPTIPIKGASGTSGGKSFNKKMTQNNTSSQLLLALKAFAQKSNLHRSITVGVIGYPNVGKSSIINSLTSQHGGKKQPCPVGNQAGITRVLREIKVDNKLKIIDSPGIVFPENSKKNKLSKKDYEAKLAILNAIPEKMIEDPINVVTQLLKKLAKDTKMAESFKEFYKIPAVASVNLDDFTKSVLIHIARNQGRLGRGGIPNLHAAACVVLKDWRDGKFYGWTLPNVSNKKQEIKVPTNETTIIEQPQIVQEWSKEFDLDTLFSDVFGNK